MSTITTTNGHIVLIDDDDQLLLSDRRWYGVAAGRKRNKLYAQSTTHPPVLMHRAIMAAPRGIQVDHRNGNGLDNRRTNLRLATQHLNMANTASRGGSSPFKGVSFDKRRGRWVAFIKVDYRSRGLGRFDTEEEAARAYDAAAIEAWGEFARPNFGAV